ncbi:Cyclic nucleotide-gated ion channel 1 [Olea europaea subsp. europaea]|uniref:Cyclic nucleotide-gated ion channel 1 n=2 Tax=Olea europaea subsp. europaea TaxID=158383 RepID=A0A8S0TX00_OLEEU|nr:Cyclic nucleotide-gated ion channel 1 [Olea europaea subsp. europaea]
MSNVYDNWGRLVGAVIRREQIWQMFHDRSPSVSSVASDFSLDSQILDVSFDFSSRAGTSLYQPPAVENSQNEEKAVKKLGSSVLEMRVKRKDAVQLMSSGLLPKRLREVIRRYDKYLLIRYLPKDLSKDVMRHVCLALLKRVPMFEKMDILLLDAMCGRLKTVLYTNNGFIWRDGDPIDEMLFIIRGELLSGSVTTSGGKTDGFSNYFKRGDFCGEELLEWAFDPNSSSNLPISTRTVQALSKAEVYALAADDLKFVVSQFRHLYNIKQMCNIIRLYSQQWRNWAASTIQVEWRHYHSKKLVREEESSLRGALAKPIMMRISIIPLQSSVSSDFSLNSQVLDVPFDFSSSAGTSLYQLPAFKKLGSSVLEMRVKRQDAIQWMSYGLLPKSLREEIRKYNKYLLIRYLPKDLSKVIMRHVCLALLKKVPMFEKMDKIILDAMCDRLKTVLYTDNGFIWRDGDPIDEMLFIIRGESLSGSVTTNGGKTDDFSNYVYLEAGGFCGEELFGWALNPNSSLSKLPISTRTVLANAKAEVFALAADDLKFVVSQFRHLYNSEQMRNIFRHHSAQWRTWAARYIQVEWRRYYRKKLVLKMH